MNKPLLRSICFCFFVIIIFLKGNIWSRSKKITIAESVGITLISYVLIVTKLFILDVWH